MGIIVILLIAIVFLAYSNGANDNFKGVATLFGSKTTNYKKAITWATVTGFPISTTYSLTGALVGAGVVAVGSQINLSVLGSKFFMPLLISPFIAVIISALLYAVFRIIRIKAGIRREYCLCVGGVEQVVPVLENAGAFSFRSLRSPEIKIAKEKECRQRYVGRVLGVSAQTLLDFAHFISAGMVSFARGLNDTPKIVALLITVKAFGVHQGMLIVAIAIALGGLLNARKVAETMSQKITTLSHGQGFTANLVTGFLVIFASRWGLPVSTTHASCGSLFGIGLITGGADGKVISKIILSWVLTLPAAAVLSGIMYAVLIYQG